METHRQRRNKDRVSEPEQEVRIEVFPERDGNYDGVTAPRAWREEVRIEVFPERDGNIFQIIDALNLLISSPNRGLP